MQLHFCLLFSVFVAKVEVESDINPLKKTLLEKR